MTREQAMEKLMAETRNACTPGLMEDFIEMSVALGMLKLDEPKSVKQRIDEAIGEYGMVSPAFALKALDAAGLKIVEK